MKYKCCNLIKHGLCFFDNMLVSCCFSPNDQINGGKPPVIIDNYNGELLSKDFLFGKISEYDNKFKYGSCPKECLNCYHIEEKEWDEDEYINSITITHFSLCSADCIYCSNNLAKSERKNDVYDILPVLNNLKEQGIIRQGVELHIGGGEFTIYSECDKLLEEYALTGFAKVYIPTNAIKYSNVLDSAIKKGTTSIIVSLDAGSRKTYEKIKKVDAFEIVLDNIRKYASNGIKYGEIALKYIVIPSINDNYAEFKKFLKVAKNTGIDHIIVDLDARYARLLNHKVDGFLLRLVSQFERIAKSQGFSTEFYSFYSQCSKIEKKEYSTTEQICDFIKYRYFNKNAAKLYGKKNKNGGNGILLSCRREYGIRAIQISMQS